MGLKRKKTWILLAIGLLIVALLLLKTNSVTGLILIDKEYERIKGTDQYIVYAERPVPYAQVYVISINPFTSANVSVLEDYFSQRVFALDQHLNVTLKHQKAMDPKIVARFQDLDGRAHLALNALKEHWSTHSTRTDQSGRFNVSVPAGKYLVLMLTPGRWPANLTEPSVQIEYKSLWLFAFQTGSIEALVDPANLRPESR